MPVETVAGKDGVAPAGVMGGAIRAYVLTGLPEQPVKVFVTIYLLGKVLLVARPMRGLTVLVVQCNPEHPLVARRKGGIQVVWTDRGVIPNHRSPDLE